jgi:hypothetical protein
MSDRKIKANRANARASTGPKTAPGRARAARNAFRHGLSLPIYSDPALSEEVDALAREIAGMDANAEVQAHARRVAEAQIDLRRVRYARHQLLSHALSNPYYESRSRNAEETGSHTESAASQRARNIDGDARGVSSLDAAGAGEIRNDSVTRGQSAAGPGSV